MESKTPVTPRQVVSRLWQCAGGSLLLSSVLIAVLVLAPSWYMLEVYDRVVASRNVMTLGMLTLGVMLLIGLLELIEWHRAETLRVLSHALDQALAEPVAVAAFESVRKRGVQAGQQAFAALQTLRSFVVSPGFSGLLDAPLATVYLALLWFMHPALCAVALVAALLQLASAWWLDRQNAEPMRQGGQLMAGAQLVAQQGFDQASSWQALGMQQALTRRWAGLLQQASAPLHAAARRQAAHQAISRWVQQAVGSALLGVACWLLLDQLLPGGAGMLIVASLLGGRVVAPLMQLVNHGAALGQARTAWKTLGELLSGQGTASEPLKLPPPRGQLSVEQLVVMPPTTAGGQRAPLLRGLSFAVAPGEILVVLGPSGAGKSTLAQALVGVLAPAAGSVRLDGADLSVWPREALGPYLGLLPQQVALLNGSLAENVCRFGPFDATSLEQALTDAGLLPLVASLPDGVMTELGEGGGWLSGGWRQRVALARALYGRPTFLVLDEPNASLDSAGEAALEQALHDAKARGCTVVVMSHKTSLVRLADHLLVLRDGQQVAFGARDEVLAAMRASGESRSPAVKAAIPAPQIPRPALVTA